MKLCLGCMEYYDDEYDVCPHCGFVEGTEAEEAYHIQPGAVLQDKYLVGRVLGYGGFGVTYIGWDMEMERKVAIKEYFPSEFSTRMPESTQVTVFSGDKEEQFQAGLDKFVDEARRLAKFHSSNGIIHIFDSFKENNTAYIVMEYLEGETLKEKLKREGKLDVEESLGIILPILYALKEVHKLGIIHRDIAPDNIYLTNQTDEKGNRIVKLLDFGAARFSTTSHSRSLSVLVKPGYSPEEQYRSRGDQGTWTDVYSVSATLYRMITGVVPQDALERQEKDEVKTPSKLGIKINKSLENAILNGMNIKIENRTQSVDVLIEELESEQTKRRKEHIRHTDIGKWPTWLKVTSGALASAVAVFVLLLATGVISFNILGLRHQSIPEGQTRVPNVINMAVDEAETKAKKAEFEFQIVDKQYSSDIPAGKILKQNYLGGSLVDKEDKDTGAKATLAVTVSAGEETTYVPDVENFMLEVAQEQISSANLVSTYTEQEGDDAPGSVAEQNPEADTEVTSGSNVELVVSTGRNFDASILTTVPDVVGMDYSDAKTLLIGQCLYLAKAEMRTSDDIPKGQIIEQDIAAGESIAQNSTIMVVVSAGTEYTYVPDVEYKTSEEASALLQARNLTVKIKEKDSDVVQKGHVISQSVAAGERVIIGTEVTIYISKGNDKADNTITVNDIVITKDVQEQQEDKTPTVTVNMPTSDNRVTVPNVVGKNQSSASGSLSSAGLISVTSQAFSSTVEEGKVISQSVAAGSKVDKNTSVVIVVSKGPEAPSGWTTDASFVNNPYYTVQSKTQYRKQTRTKETTEQIATSQPATPSGYTYENAYKYGWKQGDWVDNGENAVSAYEKTNSKREVSTYAIAKSDPVYVKQYKYFYYKLNIGGTDYYRWWYEDGSTYKETDWRSEMAYKQLMTAQSHGSMYAFSDSYNATGWGYIWYYLSERDVVDHYNNYTVTGYKYRDSVMQYRYVYYRYTAWSDWSAWQDSAITASDTVNVETQTVYYYTAK